MMEGLVQHDTPLTLKHNLDRMRGMYGDSEVVTLTDDGVKRATYAEVGDRADRLCRALEGLGVEQGDRVATFCWNHQEHLELYMAVPCMGAVLHTINIRLFAEQVTYIANHAQDKVLFVDDNLVEKIEEVLDDLETIEHFVVIGDGDTGSLPNAIRYEDLLAEQEPGYDYPDLDDHAAAGLAYTSGTTGNPKGVLYSHKSQVLHSLVGITADVFGLRTVDRVLPIVPMFHVNAWGLPYAATMSGADLIMPGRFLQAEPLAKLIESERVTVSGAVPTVWLDILRYIDENDADLSCLREVVCGGAAVPLHLMQSLEERHGIRMTQAWGMTETSPIASLARPPQGAEGDEYWRYRATAGRIAPMIEARIITEEGEEAPQDGEATGELEVRGPYVASRYYEDPSGDEKFHDGWLRTGDIAAIDPQGFIRITDRTKDVIKSGGEWISSLDLEGELITHSDVLEVAVIAKPDDRWSERPLACVVLEEGASASAENLRQHLMERVAKWWVPDEYAFIDEVPKTATGKFDKKVLRQRLDDDELGERVKPGEKEKASA
ncbi:MAG: long-chain fatty acid--CoA ligase [Thermoleophilaceae bacterium]